MCNGSAGMAIALWVMVVAGQMWWTGGRLLLVAGFGFGFGFRLGLGYVRLRKIKNDERLCFFKLYLFFVINLYVLNGKGNMVKVCPPLTAFTRQV